MAGSGVDGLTGAKVLEAFDLLGTNDVPDDGDRFAVVGWKQWWQLLKLDEFASADLIEFEHSPWRGTQAKRWRNTLWFIHSGLPLTDGVRSCFWYHKGAVFHASGDQVMTDVEWHQGPDDQVGAYFVSTMLAQGALLINDELVVEMPCKEG